MGLVLASYYTVLTMNAAQSNYLNLTSWVLATWGMGQVLRTCYLCTYHFCCLGWPGWIGGGVGGGCSGIDQKPHRKGKRTMRGLQQYVHTCIDTRNVEMKGDWTLVSYD